MTSNTNAVAFAFRALKEWRESGEISAGRMELIWQAQISATLNLATNLSYSDFADERRYSKLKNQVKEIYNKHTDKHDENFQEKFKKFFNHIEAEKKRCLKEKEDQAAIRSYEGMGAS